MISSLSSTQPNLQFMLMIIHPMLSEETIKEVLKELEKVPAELSLCVIDNEILANASKCHILVTSDEDHS